MSGCEFPQIQSLKKKPGCKANQGKLLKEEKVILHAQGDLLAQLPRPFWGDLHWAGNGPREMRMLPLEKEGRTGNTHSWSPQDMSGVLPDLFLTQHLHS